MSNTDDKDRQMREDMESNRHMFSSIEDETDRMLLETMRNPTFGKTKKTAKQRLLDMIHKIVKKKS